MEDNKTDQQKPAAPNRDRLNYLLARYKSGSILPFEKDELTAILTDRVYGDEILRLIEGSSKYGSDIARMYSYNEEKVWNRVVEAERRRTRRRVIAFVTAAAVLLLALLIPFTVFFQGVPEKKENKITSEIKPGQKFVYLESSQGEMFSVRESEERQIAVIDRAVAGVHDGELRISTPDRGKSEKEPRIITIHVPSGCESMPVVLGDGTKVWLNSSSSLNFPDVFDNDRREVELTGEAYFEVAKDADRPFSVVTDGQSIRVLGTSFNIRAYPDDDNIETTLVTGKLEVRADTEAALLNPGEQAVVNRFTGDMAVSEVVPELYMLWIRGEFFFRDETVESICKKFSRWYNIEFEIDESVKKISYTGVLKRYDSFNTIADLMTRTGEFYIKEKNGVIGIYPQPKQR